MNGYLAEMNTFSGKEYLHSAVPDDSVKVMIYRFYFIVDLLFLNMIIGFRMLQIVIISINADAHMSK